MALEQVITPQAINEWLRQHQRSREWLAAQTGSSTTTVAGWLQPGKPRPIPEPTLLLIERMMCDDLLGEPQFNYQEAKVVRLAMEEGGYTSLRDFVRDSVIANARESYKIWRRHASLNQNAPYYLKLLGWAGYSTSDPAPDADGSGPEPVIRQYPPGYYALKLYGGVIHRRAAPGDILVVKPWDEEWLYMDTLVIVNVDGRSVVKHLSHDVRKGDLPQDINIYDEENPTPVPVKGRIEGVVAEIL